MNQHDSDSWLKACQDKLLLFKETCMYILVSTDEAKSRKIVGCRWVFALKKGADGAVERYKARIVAKGYSQVYQLDYDETFAPAVKWVSIRILLAIGT